MLYVTAEVVRQIAILVQPVMPASGAWMLDQLAVPATERSFAALGEPGRLAPATVLPPAEPVFPRYVEKEAQGEESA